MTIGSIGFRFFRNQWVGFQDGITDFAHELQRNGAFPGHKYRPFQLESGFLTPNCTFSHCLWLSSEYTVNPVAVEDTHFRFPKIRHRFTASTIF